MTQSCRITLSASAIPASLDDLGSADLDVFFAVGIVNPLGPTLTFVAALGAQVPGADLPLVKVVLHPFTQQVEQVGRFRVGESWCPREDFPALFGLGFGDCPTLVLVHQGVPEEDRQPLVADLLATFGDGVATNVQLVREHFGDPWTRVTAAAVHGDESITARQAAEALAPLVLDARHVAQEVRAFLAAWHGSIEKTGIPDHLKLAAFGYGRFKAMLFDRVLPSLWLPDAADQPPEPAPAAVPQRLRIDSLEHLHDLLEQRAWEGLDEHAAMDLLRSTLRVYGHGADTRYVRPIGALYRHMLRGGLALESRLVLEDEMVRLVESGQCLPVVFLVFLVEDDAYAVVTKAVIDFVSTSGYHEGELYALKELRSLFLQGALGDRGTVFGALVAMGDPEVMALARELRDRLTAAEARSASKVHTPFPQHHAIRFWVEWAMDLLPRKSPEDLAKFGACASALALVLRHDRVGEVSQGKRNFPCHEQETPVTLLDRWPLRDYAGRLAGDLYALEAGEDPPRIFSDVLRAWGLKPRAPLHEQFFDDAMPGQDDQVRLRDPGGVDARSSTGFLEQLLGKRR